ncbi:unnamed protein product [Nippostrongylus brasiliensis]|uniref:SCP domain-containing protein n=1 Tax=Nippostrongylus brasiliensis TaxID=27835 RepID=A0A0N4Y7W6_NIPBR|nr:unnamed protein product [Nippostrongylus brasiliensis]
MALCGPEASDGYRLKTISIIIFWESILNHENGKMRKAITKGTGKQWICGWSKKICTTRRRTAAILYLFHPFGDDDDANCAKSGTRLLVISIALHAYARLQQCYLEVKPNHTWSCELELIAAVNTIGCKKVFLPEGTSMNYLMVPFMDVPFGKGVLLSFAMADWKKNSLHIGMDDDVTFTDASLEEFANMIYYKSIAVGCSYSACPFPPQSEAIACVFSSVPTLNSQIYEPDSKAIGCSNDFDCSKIVPDAVCDLLNGLCITEVNQASLLATGNVINGRTGSNCKPAKNMLEMKYDRSLEVEAQIYANKCPQSEVSSPVALRPRSGENVKIIWSDNIPYMEAVVAAAQSWWDEIAIESINPSMLFIRRLLSKPLAPIRFTQMAWATTFRVGCGVNRCKGFTVVACRYRPRGNIVGQFVYRVGPTCDECRYHCIAKEGLCLAPLA